MQIGSKDSPLKESIVFSDEGELESDQNSFSLYDGLIIIRNTLMCKSLLYSVSQ